MLIPMQIILCFRPECHLANFSDRLRLSRTLINNVPLQKIDTTTSTDPTQRLSSSISSPHVSDNFSASRTNRVTILRGVARFCRATAMSRTRLKTSDSSHGCIGQITRFSTRGHHVAGGHGFLRKKARLHRQSTRVLRLPNFCSGLINRGGKCPCCGRTGQPSKRMVSMERAIPLAPRKSRNFSVTQTVLE